jgi:hypothetical protein
MSDKERALWQAISRGLKLIVSAIDRYVAGQVPPQQRVADRTRNPD